MLVLTRKAGEGIYIGEDVLIKIFEIEGDRVKIGIEAPKTTKVLRLELYEDISGENIKATGVSKDVIDELFKGL
ncbi:MAG: carbon storage regulator CsrA [Tepidanaerobacter acetatoxydans]|uniref:carbon storage regulator CsrA n=1 Tax=Tepidanaerobacter TaxID=499228 RepID=UPI000AA1E59B|nr:MULTISPECIES: carbon storage regulator CsrA [Tepidanaerobacter]NLU10742.1 carbon storage regulator CsrA [Tepidanaerobacter acetatoxydans]